RKRNLVETGLGYSSDIGPKAKIKWTRPWVNEKGHSFEVTGDVSAKEQVLDLSYRIPTQDDPLGDYWLVQGGYKYTDLNDTQSSQFAASVSRNQELESGWVRSASLNVLSDNFTQAAVDNNKLVIYPGISFTRTRARGGLSPEWGDTQRYAVSVANGIWASESDFVRMEASQTWLRTFAAKHRFIVRASLGWIETDDLNGVPPDLRFFAGGDNSVRGYDYKSISPKNESGELTGGSKMATASLEYQYNVTGNWWAAAFVDAGDSVKKFDEFSLNKGAGVGVRWNSPIGPVKVDVAWPIASDLDRGMHFYFGLGGAL
ncbi:MAG: autotransporter assembly complex family protein, partial [Sutterellaceae bacterium]|nr:autotransporter assembly complex family protein [Sutterellaceae bacterium]